MQGSCTHPETCSLSCMLLTLLDPTPASRSRPGVSPRCMHEASISPELFRVQGRMARPKHDDTHLLKALPHAPPTAPRGAPETIALFSCRLHSRKNLYYETSFI